MTYSHKWLDAHSQHIACFFLRNLSILFAQKAKKKRITKQNNEKINLERKFFSAVFVLSCRSKAKQSNGAEEFSKKKAHKIDWISYVQMHQPLRRSEISLPADAMTSVDELSSHWRHDMPAFLISHNYIILRFYEIKKYKIYVYNFYS